MTGTYATSEMEGLEPVLARINALADPRRQGEALALIGGLVESQTKARFDEARSPDGVDWAPWSESYANSRHHGQSLLVASGALRDSVAWDLTGDELAIGSNLVYAAIHQFGGTEDMPAHLFAIPAREWLGLSDFNVGEINDAIGDWIDGVLQ